MKMSKTPQLYTIEKVDTGKMKLVNKRRSKVYEYTAYNHSIGRWSAFGTAGTELGALQNFKRDLDNVLTNKHLIKMDPKYANDKVLYKEYIELIMKVRESVIANLRMMEQ